MADGKADKEFFESITGKVDWDHFTKHSQDEAGNAVVYELGIYEKTVISLLVELNATMALMCNLIYESTQGQQMSEPEFVMCPGCKKKVVPNDMGYCSNPDCKHDLAQYIQKDGMKLST